MTHFAAATGYLVFGLGNTRYAVEVDRVEEVVELPELTPVAEAPSYIVGVVNVRGRVVPVLDFNRRLGFGAETYSPSDYLMVFRLQGDGGHLGLIVNQIHDMCEISPADLEAMPAYGPAEEVRRLFVETMAKVDDELIAVVNVENLARLPQELSEWAGKQDEDGEVEEGPLAPERAFCPEATDEEREIYRRRARNLRHAVATEGDAIETGGLAVVKMGEEYFGVDLGMVSEIVAVDEITPVPCCPDFVAGAVNLRGVVVVLVDFAPALDLPPLQRATVEQALVVRTEGLQVGVLVESVLDVVAPGVAQAASVPAAVQTTGENYIRSTLPFEGQMLGELDLIALLASGRFDVYEEI